MLLMADASALHSELIVASGREREGEVGAGQSRTDCDQLTAAMSACFFMPSLLIVAKIEFCR